MKREGYRPKPSSEKTAPPKGGSSITKSNGNIFANTGEETKMQSLKEKIREKLNNEKKWCTTTENWFHSETRKKYANLNDVAKLIGSLNYEYGRIHALNEVLEEIERN